jgi:nucleotide-binding universal stress UspA family protein
MGNPRFVVLDEVKRRKPDLAVVGTHGLSGLPPTILGTVAETLIADAECDVLVVQ